MRDLSPVQVLAVIAQRLEKRAAVLERVRTPGFDGTIHELRNFAAMVKRAKEYIRQQQFKRH